MQVADGIFSVVLGESPQPPIGLTFDQDLWLEIYVEGDMQTPRQQIGSVGYAYMASGLVPGTEVSGNVSTGLQAVIAGSNSATTFNSCGFYGESTSTVGCGVYGFASSSSGANRGVYGRTVSSQGSAVFGYADVTTGAAMAGEFLSYAPSGCGVYSETMASTGSNAAIWGHSMATAGTTHGVRGYSYSSEGSGVYGEGLAETGGSYGVYGRTYSIAGNAVRAYASATTGPTVGLYSRASSNTEATAVYGWASAGSGEGWGVWGHTSSNNSNAYGVYYTGGIGGSGLMANLVRTPDGVTKLYCQASSECWFEDIGEGRLVAGKAHVTLDPLFLTTVTIDEAHPMHVFIQLHDPECQGVAVERGTSSFDVVELREGRSNTTFSYRVVAKRKGFEVNRLEITRSARRDPSLYPEEWQEELERENARIDRENRRLEEDLTRINAFRAQRNE